LTRPASDDKVDGTEAVEIRLAYEPYVLREGAVPTHQCFRRQKMRELRAEPGYVVLRHTPSVRIEVHVNVTLDFDTRAEHRRETGGHAPEEL
jgi:hypothetical protein